MSQTLYRKYRPGTFEELTGQQHVKRALEQQIATDTIAHAYLFTGPRGVGKTTSARLLAAAVNATDDESRERILKGKDLDVIEIDAASHTSVDNVRENIIENARFTPQHSKYKVFIIDEVHMLSTAAFNALLKVLEEPPKNTIFILATTELHKVPATIISRCQRFDFKKIPTDQMVERLARITASEKVVVDEDVLRNIARHSEGCLRDAESLLGQVLSLGDQNITSEQAALVLPASLVDEAVQLIQAIVSQDAQKALELLHEVVDNGGNISEFAKEIIEVTRKVMIYAVAGSLQHMTLELSPTLEKDITTLSTQISVPRLVKIIDVMAKRRHEIKSAVIPELPLEAGIMELIYGNEVVQSAPTVQKKTLDSEIVAQTKPIEPVQKESLVPKTQEELREEIRTETVSEEVSGTVETQVSSLHLTIVQIKSRWHVFLQELQKKSPSLVLILKTAEPLSCENGVVMIGYKYPFHKDKLTQGTSYETFLEVFEQMYHAKPKFEGSVLPQGYTSEFLNEINDDDEVEFVADTTIASNTTSITQSVQPIQQQEVIEQPSLNDAPRKQEEEKSQPTPDDIIQSLVQAFGGRVVE